MLTRPQRDVPIPLPLPPRPVLGPYTQYERMKAQLNRRCWTPQQYAHEVRKIAERLEV